MIKRYTSFIHVFEALNSHVISCLQSLRFIVMHSNRNSCFCIFLSLLRMCWHFYSLLFILVKSYDQDKLKWSMAQICGCRYFSFKHDTISVWKMWHSSNYEMYDLQQTSICLYQLIIKRSVSSTLERCNWSLFSCEPGFCCWCERNV